MTPDPIERGEAPEERVEIVDWCESCGHPQGYRGAIGVKADSSRKTGVRAVFCSDPCHEPASTQEEEGGEARCETCDKPTSLSCEEANCLNAKAHGPLKTCPECGTVGMLWHKMGCSLDPENKPAPDSQPDTSVGAGSTCPTCGSDDPLKHTTEFIEREDGSYRAPLRCPDQFHTALGSRRSLD